MKNKNWFEKTLYIIFFPILMVMKLLILIYKFCISPLLPNVCKFVPTCSTYFMQALDEYGPFKGFYLGCRRLLRCNPWSKGGFDPIEPNIKGNIKWIL